MLKIIFKVSSVNIWIQNIFIFVESGHIINKHVDGHNSELRYTT